MEFITRTNRRAPLPYAPALALCVLAATLVAAVAPGARAQTNSDQVYTLRETIERTIERHPLMRKAGYQAEQAQLELQRVRSLRYMPNAEFRFETGLVPEARGDAVESEDSTTDIGNLGPFFRFFLDLDIPIWTFGKLSAAIRAAEQGLALQQRRGDLTRDEIALQATRAYWALSASEEAESLARGLREDYLELLSEVEERLLDEDSLVDNADVFEVQAFRFRVDESYLAGMDKRVLADRTFRRMLDLRAAAAVQTAAEAAPVFAQRERPLGAVRRMAERSHREIVTLQSAIDALSAKITLAQRERRPVLVLGGGFGYAETPNRDDQKNPFVVDEFNFIRAGAQLMLQWDLDFYRQNIEIRKLKAERAGLEEQLRALKMKVDLQVTEAYRRTKSNETLLDSAQRALAAAKSRLRLEEDNWETGLGEVENVIDAYRQYYELRGTELEQELAYKMSLADLAFVLGDMDRYIDWIESEHISFE